MASSSKSNQNSPIVFHSPITGPLQRNTLARVIKVEESLKDTLQMLTEIQVTQIKMAKEQEKQSKVLRNLQKFLMDNHSNPIIIEEDSSNIHVHNPPQEDEEEEEEEEEEEYEDEQIMCVDDKVICVGEVCFDKNGNLVKQDGNFCLHYPNCPIHKSPMNKNTN